MQTAWSDFRKCGIYNLTGKIKMTAQEKLTLYLNEGTESELPIYLGKYSEDDPKSILNTVIKAKIRIEKKCRFFCYGQLIEIIEYTNPFDQQQDYAPSLKIPLTKIKCKT